MSLNVRDDLFERVWGVWWKPYYHETLIETYLESVERIRNIGKSAAYLTSGGSAIAAWTIFESTIGRLIWTGIATIPFVVALLSHIYYTDDLVKRLRDVLKMHMSLRHRCEVVIERFKHEDLIDKDDMNPVIVSLIQSFQDIESKADELQIPRMPKKIRQKSEQIARENARLFKP